MCIRVCISNGLLTNMMGGETFQNCQLVRFI